VRDADLRRREGVACRPAAAVVRGQEDPSYRRGAVAADGCQFVDGGEVAVFVVARSVWVVAFFLGLFPFFSFFLLGKWWLPLTYLLMVLRRIQLFPRLTA
jgi:hypothetical protein